MGGGGSGGGAVGVDMESDSVPVQIINNSYTQGVRDIPRG